MKIRYSPKVNTAGGMTETDMEIGTLHNQRSILDGNTRVWLHTAARVINGKRFTYVIEGKNILVQEEVDRTSDGPVLVIRHYLPGGFDA